MYHYQTAVLEFRAGVFVTYAEIQVLISLLLLLCFVVLLFLVVVVVVKKRTGHI